MEWTRMIDRLPPFDKRFLLSVPWKDRLSLKYRANRWGKDLIFDDEGVGMTATENYVRNDVLWAIPDKPEGVM